MKALGIAFLTLFGSSYACEQLFQAVKYIISDTTNRLWPECCICFSQTYKTLYESRL